RDRIIKNLDSAAEDLISSGVISAVGERGHSHSGRSRWGREQSCNNWIKKKR
ncbi:hypothetical protein KI387_021392, partial [Taxus chinensis]